MGQMPEPAWHEQDRQWVSNYRSDDNKSLFFHTDMKGEIAAEYQAGTVSFGQGEGYGANARACLAWTASPESKTVRKTLKESTDMKGEIAAEYQAGTVSFGQNQGGNSTEKEWKTDEKSMEK